MFPAYAAPAALGAHLGPYPRLSTTLSGVHRDPGFAGPPPGQSRYRHDLGYGGPGFSTARPIVDLSPEGSTRSAAGQSASGSEVRLDVRGAPPGDDSIRLPVPVGQFTAPEHVGIIAPGQEPAPAFEAASTVWDVRGVPAVPGTTTQGSILSNEEIAEEIMAGIQIFRDILGPTFAPRFIRPPFGDLDLRVKAIADTLGLRVLLWNLDTKDFVTNAAGDTNLTDYFVGYKQYLTQSNNIGYFTLAHDIINATHIILPQVLQLIQDSGYTPILPSNCTGMGRWMLPQDLALWQDYGAPTTIPNAQVTPYPFVYADTSFTGPTRAPAPYGTATAVSPSSGGQATASSSGAQATATVAGAPPSGATATTSAGSSTGVKSNSGSRELDRYSGPLAIAIV
ncbi:hypothetical protein HDU93_000781, partial [Gonapodya sp. JEL0774]